jgi:uncharacterized protein (TIGR00730 family)
MSFGAVARHPQYKTLAAPQSVCVFCGSGPGDNPEFVDTACALGAALARERLGLVFGGGSLGLMGAVARASIDEGGYVLGIIPEFLRDRERPPCDLTELVVTKSMHERKQVMFDRSSAFVALPGGLGTLDEIVEQMTWVQIGRHNKPILFLNVAGYWDPFLMMIDRMRATKFIRPGLDVTDGIAENVGEVIPMIKRFWLERSSGQ